MKYKYLLFLFGIFICHNLDAQKLAEDLKISGNKLGRDFNEDQIMIVIEPKVENGAIIINLKTTNNAKGSKFYYNLYLFDENPVSRITDLESLISWASDYDDDFQIQISNPSFNFVGSFITYPDKYLEKKPYSSHYLKFEDNSEEFEKYFLKTENISEKTIIEIKYVFLISNKKDQIIGVTDPITYQIPQEIIDQIVPPKKKEVIPEKPVVVEPAKKEPANKVDQVDLALINRLNQSVDDLIAPFTNKGSYNDSWNNYELYQKYDNENYNRRIADTIAMINDILEHPMYEKSRTLYVYKLEKYLDKKNTVGENIKKNKPVKVNKCDELKQGYYSLLSSLDGISNNILKLEKTVTPQISYYEKQLKSCDSENCVKNTKNSFEKESWHKHLKNYSQEINSLQSKFKQLRNKPDFKTCSLSSDAISNKISECETALDKVETMVKIFRVTIEGNLTNPIVFEATVGAFKSEIVEIVRQFKSFQKLHKDKDDEFFTYGKLGNSDIKKLEEASLQTNEINKKIENVISKAGVYYQGNDRENKRFSEALFKQQTGIDFTENDTEQLKSNLEQLVSEAKSNTGGGLTTKILIGVVILILIVGGYSYLKGITKKKTLSSGHRPKTRPTSSTQPAATSNEPVTRATDVGGMEIIDDDENESLKGKGLDKVRKLAGVEYFEVDVQSFINDTVVRKVYFSREFAKKAYWYFEDKMQQVDNIDDLYEFGGYIIGKWDTSPYDQNQYDLSLEHFIEPGDDAKFTKFNIDFGYDISFRMESMLIDLANNDQNEQVFVGWLHSHPGHNVFLSNYDIDVQEKFRNQYHPNRHIALVLEPTTELWDMGLFTFKQDGRMNNKEEVHRFLSFDEIYNWAKGDYKHPVSGKHFTLDITNSSHSETKTVSLDKSVILDIKKFIERELSADKSSQKSFYLSGLKSGTGSMKSSFFIVDMTEINPMIKTKENKNFGLFAAVTSPNPIEELQNKYQVIIKTSNLSFIITFNGRTDSFLLIPVTTEGAIDSKENWVEFSMNDIIPFLRK